MQKALGNEAKNITNEYTSLAYFIKTKTRNVTEFERKICKILRLYHYIIVYFFQHDISLTQRLISISCSTFMNKGFQK